MTLTPEQRMRAARELAKEDSDDNPVKWPYASQVREYLTWADEDLAEHYRDTFDREIPA